MLKETADQLRAMAQRLVQLAREVQDDRIATQLEAEAIALLKRAAKLEKSPMA